MHARLTSVALLVAAVMWRATPAGAATCESLTALSTPDATITLATTVPAGTFTPPGPAAAQPNPSLTNLPAFCRVAATLRPTSDSDIKVEVWLPVSNWNGKYQAVGNGGWAGSILYAALGEALQRGYATSSTDTGHVGGTAKDMLGHPEKLIDYSYRAIHEMTVKAKTIVEAFYDRGPQLSYFVGCSAGGRQALLEAQRFPGDFNGIIAGAPAINTTPMYQAARMSIPQATLKEPASYIPPAKYPMIHQAVVNACDTLDGLKDGLIDDSRQCRFDFKAIECKSGDSATCLTAPQVQAATKILSPVMHPRSGKELLPRLEPGSELGWGVQAGGPEPYNNVLDRLKYVVFKDPHWDWKNFNLATDLAPLEHMDDPANATDPNLTAFMSRGGKLLIYHGWADQQVVPTSSINYYGEVQAATGGAGKTADWLRLFMVPGMAHCRGGDGPNTFDALTALEAWVEKGTAPNQMIASHSTKGIVDRTRPLCAYPMVARYTGTGSIDDAANFSCRVP
ncbi:MAG TPA: tannase/feruloyl esterase family alpha/beta hydrolase [Vicinamibacterales bacterium]|nr:tannase/feruloyl esterase family alpha/beta hydrolase [Vicinamibacterales bacterium]